MGKQLNLKMDNTLVIFATSLASASNLNGRYDFHSAWRRILANNETRIKNVKTRCLDTNGNPILSDGEFVEPFKDLIEFHAEKSLEHNMTPLELRFLAQKILKEKIPDCLDGPDPNLHILQVFSSLRKCRGSILQEKVFEEKFKCSEWWSQNIGKRFDILKVSSEFPVTLQLKEQNAVIRGKIDYLITLQSRSNREHKFVLPVEVKTSESLWIDNGRDIKKPAWMAFVPYTVNTPHKTIQLSHWIQLQTYLVALGMDYPLFADEDITNSMPVGVLVEYGTSQENVRISIVPWDVKLYHEQVINVLGNIVENEIKI